MLKPIKNWLSEQIITQVLYTSQHPTETILTQAGLYLVLLPPWDFWCIGPQG